MRPLKRKSNLIRGLAALAAVIQLLVFDGCAGKQIDENDPANLYKEAEESIGADHYQLAIDRLRALKNKFPYSKYAVDAQLRLADVYFLQESYPEAAIAYESFRDLHPKHERVAYAMFRIGKSHFKDVPANIARDLTPGLRALDAYQEFLRRFPTAAEAEEARKDISEIRKTLAEKELYIANFYLRDGATSSAKSRFEKILFLYPETAPAEEAKQKLARLEGQTPKSP